MPNELFRVVSGIQWLETVIHPTDGGIETVLRFNDNGQLLCITINNIPNDEFLARVVNADCISIVEFSLAERGWVENGRYQVQINDDDEIDFATVAGSIASWTLNPIARMRER